MTAAYTVSSLDEITYTVVRTDPTGPPANVPAPDHVPDVAKDAIPDRHRGAQSPDGTHEILVRRTDEPCPFADSDVECDWIDAEQCREHKRTNPEIWQSDEPID